MIFIGELDFQEISLSYSNKPPKLIPREHFSHQSGMEFMKNPGTGDRRMQFSLDRTPIPGIVMKGYFLDDEKRRASRIAHVYSVSCLLWRPGGGMVSIF